MFGKQVDGGAYTTADGRGSIAQKRRVGEHLGIEHNGYDEPDDEGGNVAIPGFAGGYRRHGGAEEEGGDQRQYDDPQGAGQLYGSCHFEGADAL